MKLYHVMCHLVGVFIWLQLLGDTGPLEFGNSKNVQNLERRRTTFDVDHKYLWSGLRHPQVVNGVSKQNQPHFEQKKIGELWSTNDG